MRSRCSADKVATLKGIVITAVARFELGREEQPCCFLLAAYLHLRSGARCAGNGRTDGPRDSNPDTRIMMQRFLAENQSFIPAQTVKPAPKIKDLARFCQTTRNRPAKSAMHMLEVQGKRDVWVTLENKSSCNLQSVPVSRRMI